MLKKLDTYIVRMFIPPFLLMFGIALFAFVMQFLWLYIDEIMGKGADLLTLSELISYLSVTFFPTSLPVGVLVASVMVLGNLAERYELSSFKSAGVSLIRVIRPLMVLCTLVAAFSFLCSNTLIPLCNLKFQARFYDLRRSKPVLSLEPGVFNDAFNGYTIRIGQKERDEETIHDVMIYDNNTAGVGKYNLIAAKHGTMRMTVDKQFMVMSLDSGYQIQELTDNRSRTENHPKFMRTSFNNYQKVFDLGQFTQGKSEDDIFANGQKTQSGFELFKAIDTIDIRATARKNGFHQQISQQLNKKKLPKATAAENPGQALQRLQQRAKADSLRQLSTNRLGQNPKKTKKENITLPQFSDVYHPESYDFQRQYGGAGAKKDQLDVLRLQDLDTLNATVRGEIISAAQTKIRSVKESVSSLKGSLLSLAKTRNSFVYEMHQKYSLAFACIIFLFVGAPMGAIVRKGGFGWPLLIAIMFFALFIVLNLMGKSFVKSAAMAPAHAAWLPIYVFLPIGFLLTYGALNDYTMQNFFEFARPITRPIGQFFTANLQKIKTRSFKSS